MAELVLVVDDNAANTRLLEALLESAGYEVMTAADADGARRAIDDRRPGLVLMDLQLPGTDGFTLTAELKARPELRDVPIIAVTAFAMRGDDERARLAGCDAYITKPIDTRAFVVTVGQVLRRAQGGNPEASV